MIKSSWSEKRDNYFQIIIARENYVLFLLTAEKQIDIIIIYTRLYLTENELCFLTNETMKKYLIKC